MITDPDGFRSEFQGRLDAEDPEAPFEDGQPRISDFGTLDTAQIQSPQALDDSVAFYVEDDYLGIPYRVTAPHPDQPDGDVTYEPVPCSPVSD